MGASETTFYKNHAEMLLKYSGISFISGAVNHGFFSSERSLWTAALGIILFVLGALLEFANKKAANQAHNGWASILLWGALLSIGLGFFTGGLQHFPDSPERSLWVVPLGFFVTVISLVLSADFKLNKPTLIYTVLVGAVVVVGSSAAFQYLKNNGAPSHHEGHSHTSMGAAMPEAAPANAPMPTMEHHNHAETAAPTPTKIIDVSMNDEMRFTPSTINVHENDIVKFMVHNAGNITHEMVIGNAADIEEHALQMQQGMNHAHAMNHASASNIGMVSVAPQETKELIFDFRGKSDLYVACLVPGHYELGMKGVVIIEGQGVESKPTAPASEHHH